MFHEGVFQWSRSFDDFPLELLHKPPGWFEFNPDVLPGESSNLKYNFRLDGQFIVEDPFKLVVVFAVNILIYYTGVFLVQWRLRGQRRGKSLSRIEHTEGLNAGNPEGLPVGLSYGLLVEFVSPFVELMGLFSEFVGLLVEFVGHDACAVL